MRATVADITPESRVAKAILRYQYSEFSDELRQVVEFSPDGWESVVDGAIAAAYRASRLNGGSIKKYLEGDHALFLELYQTSNEVEPLSDIAGDVKRILNRAARQRIDRAIATILQAPSQAFEVYQQLRKTEPPKRSALPEIITDFDFTAKDLPKAPELIIGLLHQGSKLALGGGSKSFKTWQLLDMALSIAYGKPWLSHETRPGRVLYINFEIQEQPFQDRLNKVTAAKGINPSGQLSVWNLRGKAADFRTLIPMVIDAVKDKGFVLIVFDPVYKLYGSTDENKAGDVAALLNAFETVTVQTGAAVAFGAHFSKGNQAAKESIDRISGSGVFARDPDSLLVFTKHETEDAFTVEATLRNFPPVDPFVVRWQYPLMVPDDSLDPAKLKQVGGRKKEYANSELFDLLPEGGLENQEWMESAKTENGITERTFYRLRGELKASGQVLKSKVNGKWMPVKK